MTCFTARSLRYPEDMSLKSKKQEDPWNPSWIHWESVDPWADTTPRWAGGWDTVPCAPLALLLVVTCALMVGASGGLWIFIRAFLPVDQPRQTPCQELGEVLTEWILFQVGIKAEHTLAWGYGARGIEIFLQLQDSLAVRRWELTHTHTRFLLLTWSAVSRRLNGREREERENGVSY